METNGRMMGCLKLWVALLLLALATAAEAATVSGTVTNNTNSAGRVFLVGKWTDGGNAGWGKSVTVAANGTVPFTIRGVLNGNYLVHAFLDTQNSGILHANDPVGSAPFSVTGGADVTDVSVSLNPQMFAPLAPPAGAQVVSGDGGVLVVWEPATEPYGTEITSSYRVYWSTAPNPGPGNTTGGGSVDSPALGDINGYFRQFANGTQLYFSVTAKLNGNESDPVNANSGVPVTVGPPTGGVTVSGTVTTTGATLGAATPLYLALATIDGPQNIYRIAAPSTSQAFSIPGVQPGNYAMYAIVDMDNNGFINVGDITNNGTDGTPVAVAGTPVTNADVTLSGGNATVLVRTDHWRQGVNERYSLNLQLSANRKRPVNAAVSGPNLSTGTIDMPVSNWGPLQSWPGLTARPTLTPTPDSYSFAIEYSDGTTTGTSPLVAPVTGIIDSFATPVSPVGLVPYPFSGNFSWSAPASPPIPYTYSFNLDVPGFKEDGYYRMPSSTTSIIYPLYGFIDGSNYIWSIAVVDRLGNVGRQQVQFTPTSAPVITGFSPQSGIPGAHVTITGFNFGATPSSNQVSFHGIQAEITSASVSSLQVIVPNSATTGPIGVTNLTSGKYGISTAAFTVLPTISFSGNVKDANGVNLGGVTVSLMGYANSVATDASGNFTLYNIPVNTDFSLMFSKPGYATEYSGINNSATSITGRNFKLYNLATLQSSWGLQAGKGVVVGYVKTLMLDGNYQNVQGATVTITGSSPSGSYTVQYDNGTSDRPAGGIVTSSTGRFYVVNVASGTTLTMTANKKGATFPSGRFVVNADSVTYGEVRGSDVEAPVITGFFASSPVKVLVIPITTFTATDNIGVTGYMITESPFQPGSGAPWSATAPTSYSVAGPGSHTLYGWARDGAGNVSLASVRTVIVDQTPPVVTANPAGGMYVGPQNVYLTANEPVTIYYTTSGTDPTTASPKFIDSAGNVPKGPIAISRNTTLKYFAKDLAGNSSTIQTVGYKITPVKVGSKEFFTIQAAYNDGGTRSSDVIKVKKVEKGALAETDIFARGIAVTLAGGYDDSYGVVIGTTQVKGKLLVRAGTVRVRKVSYY